MYKSREIVKDNEISLAKRRLPDAAHKEINNIFLIKKLYCIQLV